MTRWARHAPTAARAVDADGVARCAADLATAAGDVFASLERLGAAMAASWHDDPRPFDHGRLSALQVHVFTQLDQRPEFESAGYVLTEDALADRPRYLEWWHRAGDRGFEPLLLNLDPDAVDYYDYYAMEWFAAALADHRRFVSGPLIDLPCADVCIMTFSSPIVVSRVGGDRLLGIAGADVALSRLEATLLPPMRRLGAPAVLINSERRVITSNDARWTTGERLPALPHGGTAEWQAAIPVTADLGWSLAVATD